MNTQSVKYELPERSRGVVYGGVAALLLPTGGRWSEQRRQVRRRVLRMEFKTFVNNFVKLPCQVVQQGRRTLLRVLSWNEHLPTFFRLCTVLRCCGAEPERAVRETGRRKSRGCGCLRHPAASTRQPNRPKHALIHNPAHSQPRNHGARSMYAAPKSAHDQLGIACLRVSREPAASAASHC